MEPTAAVVVLQRFWRRATPYAALVARLPPIEARIASSSWLDALNLVHDEAHPELRALLVRVAHATRRRYGGRLVLCNPARLLAALVIEHHADAVLKDSIGAHILRPVSQRLADALLDDTHHANILRAVASRLVAGFLRPVMQGVDLRAAATALRHTYASYAVSLQQWFDHIGQNTQEMRSRLVLFSEEAVRHRCERARVVRLYTAIKWLRRRLARVARARFLRDMLIV